MSIFHNKDVNALLGYNKNSKHISLSDIYAKVFNVDSATAMRKSTDYMNKHHNDKAKPESD